MNPGIKSALVENGVEYDACLCCGCGQLNVEGSTSDGIDRIECPECGRLAVRMMFQDVLKHYSAELAFHIQYGHLEQAGDDLKQFIYWWTLPGTAGDPGRVWLVTNDGRREDDIDDIPF